MRISQVLTAGIFGVLLAGAVTAQATPLAPVMTLSIGGVEYTDPSGSLSKTVNVSGNKFNGSTFLATGYPAVGTLDEPEIDLVGSLRISGAGTLVVKITQQHNANLASVNHWLFDSEFSDTMRNTYHGLTISYQSYIDTTDAKFGTGTPLDSLLNSGATTSFSAPDHEITQGNSLFSMTEIITLTATASTNSSPAFTATLSGVDPVPAPEPASLALLGVGIVGLGLIRRKSIG